uniref:Si:dkey-30e9.6 n=1 Tax=Seriola dumerili TaxID=41447 RepID=A0A3B4T3T5_SERDU
FEGKIQFSASQDLRLARSKYFKLPETEIQSDVWSIKPPDFSLKLYRSLSIPQEKERKTTVEVPQTTETKRRTGIFLPNVLDESYKRKDHPKFITLYRPPDPLQTELMFIRMGKYLSEPYKNPKPHNFRPLDDDLPDIVTTYERDPGNLNLKLRHLDTMDTYKPAEPRWDAGLILPLPPWPPKSASYTRHRRRRGAHSAFLDRVEEKLSRSWKN